MKLLDWFKKLAKSRAKKAGHAILNEVVKSISEPYPPASSPGNPPHRRIGGLIKKVKAGKVIETANGARIQIEQPAGFLQFGTKKMKARPFMDAALRKLNLKRR